MTDRESRLKEIAEANRRTKGSAYHLDIEFLVTEVQQAWAREKTLTDALKEIEQHVIEQPNPYSTLRSWAAVLASDTLKKVKEKL